MNQLINKVQELSEKRLELKTIEDFQSNFGDLKEIFKAIFEKSKETQEFINKLDLAQIVESSMDYLQDEFYDKFVPLMKDLEKMIKKKQDSLVGTELADLRKQLQRRVIDAQAIFSETIGKTPYKLEQLESLQTIRKNLIPQLEKEIEKLNKNVDGIEEEIYQELSNNYKSLLEILRNLKLEIEAINEKLEANKDEVEKLVSSSVWIKEQLSQREKELAEKDSECKEIKSQLAQREQEIIGAIETTKIEMESSASEIEATEKTKLELEKIVIEKDKEIERINEELEEQKIIIMKKEKEITEITRQLDEIKSVMVEKEQDISETEIIKLKYELNDLLQFLEKSPRYQLLFLINNKETITLKKIQELFKFDMAITRSILDDLKERNFISFNITDDDLTVKIEQKLNPLSCIELENIFENNLLKEIESKIEMKSVSNTFEVILEKIAQLKKSNKEEAGFLLSLLYLYIYDSKRFEFFSKIKNLYDELKPHSFYLRLIENALTYEPWESKKTALLENLSEFPTIIILNKEFKNLRSEDISTNGPFFVNKFRPLSLLDWDNEIQIKKSDLNQHANLSELAKWVWLNGKGSSFTVEIENSKGEKSEIIVTASKSINGILVTKHYELI